MRILQLAPLWESVPPPAYGGTEAVVGLLTEELVARGHDVTLAASGDSTTSARHAWSYERSLRRANDIVDRAPYEWVHAATALKSAGAYDVIHNHAGELPMMMAGLLTTPMLTTAHCLPSADCSFAWKHYQGAYNTISVSHKRGIPSTPARFMGHVYNSIDVESFPFSDEKGDDLLFLSRVAPEKGTDKAIEVARTLGRRLIIAGKVDDYDRAYFDEVIKDQIDGEQIVFFGEADAQQKRELYKNAHCLLMPLAWEEPFGLVMIEAQACGTPVIALRRGSAPELIRHGETGFVVDTVEEMAACVDECRRISPRRCRTHVQRHFSPETMAAGYEDLYERLAERPSWTTSVAVDIGEKRSESDEAAAVA